MNKDIIEGSWQGTLTVGMVKLGITFILKRDNNGKITVN